MPISSRERPHILLVNGNTSQSVTDRLSALAKEAAPYLAFSAHTPAFGPSYVSTPADVVIAGHAIVETIRHAVTDHAPEPDACIIACFGEPGLAASRHCFAFPIVGMAEAAMLTAMQLGGRFAILTLGKHWPGMLRDLVRLYGVQDRFAGVERIAGAPLDLLASPEGIADAVAAAAVEIADRTAADIVIVGGAALAGLAPLAQPKTPVPLVDSLFAAIAQATALIETRRMHNTRIGIEPTVGH